jgi:hypothetical protein
MGRKKGEEMVKQSMEKRFGLVAVQMGFITVDQLIDAIEIQTKEDVENGEHRLIGWILLEKGYITPPQVNEVLKAMKIPVLEDD